MGADGIITTVAGNGSDCYPFSNACGDGGPAMDAAFNPAGVAVRQDGSFYIVDMGYSDNYGGN